MATSTTSTRKYGVTPAHRYDSSDNAESKPAPDSLKRAAIGQESAPQSAFLTTPPRTQLDILHAKLPGSWICPTCGALNSASIHACTGWPGHEHAELSRSQVVR